MSRTTFVPEPVEFHDFTSDEIATSTSGHQPDVKEPEERAFDLDACLKAYANGAAKRLASYEHYPSWNTSEWFTDEDAASASQKEWRFWFAALTETERLNELRDGLKSAETLRAQDYDKPLTRAEAKKKLEALHKDLQQQNQTLCDVSNIMGRILVGALGEVEAMALMLDLTGLILQSTSYSAGNFYSSLPWARDEETFEKLRAMAAGKYSSLDQSDLTRYKLALELVKRYRLTEHDNEVMERYFDHASDLYYFSSVSPIFYRLEDEEQLGYFRKVRRHFNAHSLRTLFARHGFEITEELVDAVVSRGASDNAMFEVITKLHTPRAVKGFLQLSMEGARRTQAREWLLAQGANAVAGLIPLTASRGAIREGAIAMLRTYKRRGWSELIETTMKSLKETRGVSTVQKEVLDWEPLTRPHFPEGEEPEWLKTMVAKNTWDKLPTWIDEEELPNILTADHEHMLTDAQRVALLHAAHDGVDEVAFAKEFAAARLELDLNTTGEFIWQIFDRWTIQGADKTHDWAMLAIGLLGTGREGVKLSAFLKRWPKENAYRRAQKGLAIYRMIGTDRALMTLKTIADKVKYKSVKSEASSLINRIAAARGLTAEELADRIIPDCGLDDDGHRTFDYGARKFMLVLDDDMKPVFRDLSRDKIVKNLPKPGKKDDEEMAEAARAEFRAMKKQMKEVTTAQTPRLEQAMLTGRRWSATDFETLIVGHPLMRHFGRRLLWGIYEGKRKEKLKGFLRVDEEGNIVDASDEPISLSDSQRVGIPHPLDMDDASKETWGTVFGDYEIIPPFPQLARPVFTLSDEEKKAKSITRFAGIIVSPGAIRGHIDRDGWTKGPAEDAGFIYSFYKHFGDAKLTASVGLGKGINASGPQWDDEQDLPSITFHKGTRSYGDAIALTDVPEKLISEVLFSIGKLAPNT